MRQKILISGMTCDGCVSSVSQKLLSLKEVHDISLELSSGIAVLEVSTMVNLKNLTDALPSKYTPSLELDKDLLNPNHSNSSKLKQLFPLFLIFIYLIAGTMLLQQDKFSISDFMFDFMGLFFIVFSFFKLLDYKGFPQAFAQYDPLAKRSSFYGKIYPFVEILLGIMFLLRWQLVSALLTTVIILSITTVGVIYTLFDKSKINCACLGTALKLPMTEATLIENMIMLVMATAMIFQQLG